MAAETTVFIIEDDDAVRESLVVLLEAHGLQVEAYDAPVRFARNYRPVPRRCLVLDQHLAGTTGLDFLASAAGASLDLPVILVTGQGSAAIRDRARRAGAAAYLEKPLDGERLVAAIHDAAAAAAAASGHR